MPTFFTGQAPTSSELDAFATFAHWQRDYYAAMGAADPELGCYEALGLAFSETHAFQVRFGGADDSTFITAAYAQAFGFSAGQAQIEHFQAQLDYFQALYTSAGVSVDAAAIRARGAVVGQMLGHAAALA